MCGLSALLEWWQTAEAVGVDWHGWLAAFCLAGAEKPELLPHCSCLKMSFQHLWKTVLLNIIFGYSFLFCFMIDDDGSYADNRSKFGHRFPTCLCFAWNAGSVCAVMRT